MLKKLKGRSMGYQAWAMATALAALFVLVRWFAGELQGADYLLMAFVNVSILVDLFLAPDAPDTTTQLAP